MKISVAIATYNGEKYICDQLESIKSQTRLVDEVIITDDGSTDGTVHLIESFIKDNNLTDWHLYRNKKNLGFYNNFMKAINMTKGDIIFLADQDDIWIRDKVQILEPYFKDNDVMGVCSSHTFIDSSGYRLDIPFQKTINHKTLSCIESQGFDFECLLGFSDIKGCSLAFRGSIREELKTRQYLGTKLGHDWIISVLCVLNGKLLFCNCSLFEYRIHRKNTSREKKLWEFKKEKIEKRNELSRYRDIHNCICNDYIERLTIQEKKSLDDIIDFYNSRITYFDSRNKIKYAYKLFKKIHWYKQITRTTFMAYRMYVTDLIHGI